MPGLRRDPRAGPGGEQRAEEQYWNKSGPHDFPRKAHQPLRPASPSPDPLFNHALPTSGFPPSPPSAFIQVTLGTASPTALSKPAASSNTPGPFHACSPWSFIAMLFYFSFLWSSHLATRMSAPPGQALLSVSFHPQVPATMKYSYIFLR